jgi:flavin-dependent thymidylate synthase
VKVELIDYTGAGSSDPLYAAKKLIYVKSTRLQRSPEVRAEIMNMEGEKLQDALLGIVQSIRSSWEFVCFTFEVTGISRAAADQVLRTRHGSYAVQAMRVVDMGHFDYVTPPSILENPEAMEVYRDHMASSAVVYRTLQDLGIPNQDCRGVIPMNACTNFNGDWDLSTLAGVCGKRDNLRAQGEYMEFVRLLKAEVFKVMPWTRGFIEPERTQTPAIQAILAAELGHAGPLDKPLVNQALKELDMLKATWG